MDIPTAIISIFTRGFLLRAFIVGTLVSLCASLLGVSLVLKRYSMIGDGLSHVGLGALAVAAVFHFAPLWFSIPIVVISAFLLLRLNDRSVLSDSAIAMISSGALAIAVIVTSLANMNSELDSYMFGSIVAVSEADTILSVSLSVVLIALFILFYNKIFAVTFDENFAKATGTDTSLVNSILAIMTAVTIVIGMRMMGALLISSLIIFPCLSAMRVFRTFRSVCICSAILSVVCFFIGLIISCMTGTPTGASIVCINIAAFAVFYIIGRVAKAAKK